LSMTMMVMVGMPMINGMPMITGMAMAVVGTVVGRTSATVFGRTMMAIVAMTAMAGVGAHACPGLLLGLKQALQAYLHLAGMVVGQPRFELGARWM